MTTDADLERRAWDGVLDNTPVRTQGDTREDRR